MMSRRIKNISKPLENVVLYLNSGLPATNTTIRKITNSAGTKNTEITFFISPITISEYSVLKVMSIAHASSSHASQHGNSVLQFRLGNSIQYNPDLYRSNDNSAPILFAMSYTDNEPAYWSNIEGIYLPPQTINSITLILSDDLANPAGGIDKDLNFIIGLVFQEYDRKYSDVEN
jgi:hypothetical protein